MAIIINPMSCWPSASSGQRNWLATLASLNRIFRCSSQGKCVASGFSTLEKICERLACQPGDILEWREGGAETDGAVDELADT